MHLWTNHVAKVRGILVHDKFLSLFFIELLRQGDRFTTESGKDTTVLSRLNRLNVFFNIFRWIRSVHRPQWVLLNKLNWRGIERGLEGIGKACFWGAEKHSYRLLFFTRINRKKCSLDDWLSGIFYTFANWINNLINILTRAFYLDGGATTITNKRRWLLGRIIGPFNRRGK